MRASIPRRQAREIVAHAERVVRHYKSLDPLLDHPWESIEVPVDDFLELFNENPRWKLEVSDGAFKVYVPNVYAYEHYEVVP